jgi:hypothetical protein
MGMFQISAKMWRRTQMSKSWTDLSDEEFEQVLDNLSNPEYEQLTDAEFFGALKAMDEADEIKLTAHLENGQLVFDEPASLPVEGNVIRIGVKRIVVELVQQI